MKPIEELNISRTPWTFNAGEQSVRYGRTSKVTGAHYPVCSRGAFIGNEEWESDARLIAAAPELYKSLRETLIALRNRLPSEPTLDEIEIISRAEDAMADAGGAEG